MDPIKSTLIYKVVCLASGLVFGFLGYKLFVQGIFAGAGDLDASFKNNKLILKKAAPGTFFALFGAIVISFTVGIGLRQEQHTMGVPHVSGPGPMNGEASSGAGKISMTNVSSIDEKIGQSLMSCSNLSDEDKKRILARLRAAETSSSGWAIKANPKTSPEM